MTESNGGPAKRFDLASVAQASRPSTVVTAGSLNGADSPFLKTVRESYAKDKLKRDSGWQELPVPSDQMDNVITALRGLSTWFGSTKNGKVAEPIGVHIRVEYQPDGMDKTIEVGPKNFAEIPDDGREVFVKYTGRERLQRGRKGSRSGAAESHRGQAATADDAPSRTVEDDEQYDNDELTAV